MRRVRLGALALVLGGGNAGQGAHAYGDAAGVPVLNERTCRGTETALEACESLHPCDECVPQDCSFSSWADWYSLGGCSGLCARSRGIRQINNDCGAPCRGPLMDTQLCENNATCMQDDYQNCELSQWTSWATCTSGQHGRNRRVAKQASAAGKSCLGFLEETRACGEEVPSDCEFTSWGEWSPCSQTCGGGWRLRNRGVSSDATFGGLPCSGALVSIGRCNVSCGVAKDCELSSWSEWTQCSGHESQKRRSREVVAASANGGSPCSDSTAETLGCPLPKVQDCEFSEWSTWGECDKSCGGGQTQSIRQISRQQSGGGVCVAAGLVKTQPCNHQVCTHADSDCEFNAWSAWSSCTAVCGPGHMQRNRGIFREAKLGGRPCSGSLVESKDCGNDACTKQDCEWADWEAWGACTSLCGGGTQNRLRWISKAARTGGRSCSTAATEEIQACNEHPCVSCADAIWSQWLEWSTCSATCDDGFRTRHRFELSPAESCGKSLEGLEDEVEKCTNVKPCIEAVDCRISAWSDWTACSGSCFEVKSRHRDVAVYAQGKGKLCNNQPLGESAPCNEVNCTDGAPERVDCTFSSWEEWSSCSASCVGERQRTRSIALPSSNGGRPCNGTLHQSAKCGSSSCGTPCVDCVWNQWGEWSECSSGCVGQKRRQRSVGQTASSCGKQCGTDRAEEITVCTGSCEAIKYCVWSPWTNLGRCEDMCGLASLQRRRSLMVSTEKAAEFLFASKHPMCAGTQLSRAACPLNRCGIVPTDCVFSEWSDWAQRDAAQLCRRARVVEKGNALGGTPCNGTMTESKSCPVPTGDRRDCEFSAWGSWTDCDAGATQRDRSRSAMVSAWNGGNPCVGPLKETNRCEEKPKLFSDCELEEWGDWTTCSVTCDGGVRTRSRNFDHTAEGGGNGCTDRLAEISSCGGRSCLGESVNCVLAAWSEWSGCEHQQRGRARSVLVEGGNGGRPCAGSLEELVACSGAVPCIVSEWSGASSCSTTCGGGSQTRMRLVIQAPILGGKECPSDLTIVQDCNTQPCEQADCTFTTWDPWSACSSSCGEGQTNRVRTVENHAKPGGLGCESSLAETKSCHGRSCPKRDCLWSDWQQWGGCTCDCGGGTKERIRGISVQPGIGGKQCDALVASEVAPCNTHTCSSGGCIDAQWGLWNPWSLCSATCQGGVTSRVRNVSVEANYCGAGVLGAASMVASCNKHVACFPATDCVFGNWSSWSVCDRDCDGMKQRVRQIAVHRTGAGAHCEGSVRQSVPCNPGIDEARSVGCGGKFAVDCVLSNFSSWSACSASCGYGQHSRERKIISPASGGGKACDTTLQEIAPCSVAECEVKCLPKDCSWDDWSSWGLCDRCGGQKQRVRQVAQFDSCGGTPCTTTVAEEVAPCDRQCDDFLLCGWSNWASWSKCTASCGSGTRQRSRALVVTSTADNASLSRLDELSLRGKLFDLELHTQAMDRRRLQEAVIAFGAGAVSLVVVGAAIRPLRRLLPDARESLRN